MATLDTFLSRHLSRGRMYFRMEATLDPDLLTAALDGLFTAIKSTIDQVLTNLGLIQSD